MWQLLSELLFIPNYYPFQSCEAKVTLNYREHTLITYALFWPFVTPSPLCTQLADHSNSTYTNPYLPQFNT